MAISSALAGVVGSVPIGSVTAFAGSSAPGGWLLCGGQTVSRTQYSGLFLTIGTTWGAGDGSTTFTLPDLRGRVVAGKDDMAGTAANRLTNAGSGITGTVLASSGGSETYALGITQMPSHTHTQDAHGHVISSNSFAGDLQIVVGPRGGDGAFYSLNDSGSDANVSAAVIYARNTTATNQNTGGGAAHQNTQPTVILNYIIKAQ